VADSLCVKQQLTCSVIGLRTWHDARVRHKRLSARQDMDQCSSFIHSRGQRYTWQYNRL